jgi:hypothetical protein
MGQADGGFTLPSAPAGSQVSAMAAELDEVAEGFRSRPLDAGPYTFYGWTR